MTKAKCPVCEQPVRLTGDGKVVEHKMQLGGFGAPCPGSGRDPR